MPRLQRHGAPTGARDRARPQDLSGPLREVWRQGTLTQGGVSFYRYAAAPTLAPCGERSQASPSAFPGGSLRLSRARPRRRAQPRWRPPSLRAPAGPCSARPVPWQPPSRAARVPSPLRHPPGGILLAAFGVPLLLLPLEFQRRLPGLVIADLGRGASLRFRATSRPSCFGLVARQLGRQLGVLLEGAVRSDGPPEHDARLRHRRGDDLGIVGFLRDTLVKQVAIGTPPAMTMRLQLLLWVLVGTAPLLNAAKSQIDTAMIETFGVSLNLLLKASGLRNARGM